MNAFILEEITPGLWDYIPVIDSKKKGVQRGDMSLIEKTIGVNFIRQTSQDKEHRMSSAMYQKEYVSVVTVAQEISRFTKES